MLYQYNPVQKHTKERIWQIPYIPHKQRTSITNFTKAPKRTFAISTVGDEKFLLEYVNKKLVVKMPLTPDVDMTKIEKFIKEYTV